MRPIKNFNEYIKENIVKKQSPDLNRAKSLIKESKYSEEFLNKILKETHLSEKNANTIIKLIYDIIMEIIRAKMLEKGYNASGFGAHEAEVSYLRILNLKEKDIQFCDQLRYFRNGIIYYGKSFDKEYAKKVINFLKIIKKSIANS